MGTALEHLGSFVALASIGIAEDRRHF